MRRRGDQLAELGEVPEWLRRFVLAEWVDELEQPPEWWAHDPQMWRALGARERWRKAGQAWLDDRGRRGEWYELTRSKVVAR